MRLVSLCPSLTELVFDLGAGGALVGRTAFCCHPRGRVEAVEAVGGTKTPDVARIVALRPDLVLMNDEENRRADWEALRAAGVAVHASMPVDAAGTAAMVRSIGAAIDEAVHRAGATAPGVPAQDARPAAASAEPARDARAAAPRAAAERAEAIARAIETRAARVAERAARGAGRVRFAYLIWRAPWMAVGAGAYASALLELAGGVNVFAPLAGAARYPELDPRALAALAPELVLLGSEPFPFRERHADELAALSGIARGRIRLADGELLSWHGSRTPAGIDHAEALIGAATGS